MPARLNGWLRRTINVRIDLEVASLEGGVKAARFGIAAYFVGR